MSDNSFVSQMFKAGVGSVGCSVLRIQYEMLWLCMHMLTKIACQMCGTKTHHGLIFESSSR